ncbi:hypothetical protein D3C85_1807250 [compost metagenome]
MVNGRDGSGIEQDFLEAFDRVAQHKVERRQEDDGQKDGGNLQNEIFRAVAACIH